MSYLPNSIRQGNVADLEMSYKPNSLLKKKTIKIEIDSEDSEKASKPPGQMSPAFRNNRGFRRSAAKMSAIGNETKWPRRDNAFTAK